MAYLVNKYGKDDRLYPREATARALVDNMLYFDIGALYQNICDYLVRVPNVYHLLKYII